MITGPRVTILMPVYNGERFIAAALDSVAAQTCSDWELIVIDDGSSDGTLEIVTACQQTDRVRVLRQTNLGPAAARNRGLAEARGEFLAFLDADDCWQPAYLAKMISALDRQPAAALALAGWQYIDADGQRLPQSIVVTPAQVERLRRDLDRSNSLLPSSVVTRRHLVEACGGFDETLSTGEDWDLWLRLRPWGDFVAVPEVLVGYRTHTSNMSDSIAEMESERRKVVAKHFAGAGSGEPQRQQAASGYIIFLSALAYLRERRIAEATERLRAALALWPGLLAEAEFFFELGCAFQARGYRGTPIGLDVRAASLLLQQLLQHDLELPPGAMRPAWARACLVLAQLGLLAGDRAAARDYAWQALATGPGPAKVTALRRLLRATLPRMTAPNGRAALREGP